MERVISRKDEYIRPHRLRLEDVRLVSLSGDTDHTGPELTQRDLDEALGVDEFADRVATRIMEIRKSRRYQ
jgi:hypothetical protein